VSDEREDHADERDRLADAHAESHRFVRVGLVFYGAMALAAVVWRTGFYGEDLMFASAVDTSGPVRWIWHSIVGVGLGLAVVVASRILTENTAWGDQLGRGLAEALGQLSVPNALLLAVASGLAEEMFFRGALQPRVGWVAASLLFGVVHFVPRREFLPWTVFAIVMGFALGAVFERTGNLVAPVMAHMTVNALNLPFLVRRYGPPSGG
jgi:membrane protease YdiL (CAAX protease family)